MRPVKYILVALVILSTIFPVEGFSETFTDWQQVLKAPSTVNISHDTGSGIFVRGPGRIEERSVG